MKLFLGFALQEFTAAAMYRFEYWLQLAGNLIQMYGIYWLWNTLARQKPALLGASLDQVLTYTLLAMVLEVILRASNLPRYTISNLIRTGAIQADLLRPLDFHFHLFARSSGLLIYLLLGQGLLGTLFGVLFLGIHAPASPIYALLFVFSLALAFLVGFSLNFLIGLVSIYTIEAARISWLYYALLRFFSGQMIPLWMFPPLLAQVVALLPFQSVIGVPLSIYIGRLSIPAALQAISLQALWAGALLLLGRLAWSRAQARLIIQGG